VPSLARTRVKGSWTWIRSARAKRQMSNYKFLMEYSARDGIPKSFAIGKPAHLRNQGGRFSAHAQGAFRRVTEVMVNDFDGPMVALLGYGYNRTIHITANHPLWTGDERWQIAGEMTDNIHLTNLRELNGSTSIDLARTCSPISSRPPSMARNISIHAPPNPEMARAPTRSLSLRSSESSP